MSNRLKVSSSGDFKSEAARFTYVTRFDCLHWSRFQKCMSHDKLYNIECSKYEHFMVYNLIVLSKIPNETAVGLHVYRKEPPLGVGWVMQGWGGSYKGGVGHKGVGWVMQG